MTAYTKDLSTHAAAAKMIRAQLKAYSMYTHQVNYSQRFVSGLLAGKVYHSHLRFTSLADAEAFAARTGETFTNCVTTGDYRIFDVQIIDLADFA